MASKLDKQTKKNIMKLHLDGMKTYRISKKLMLSNIRCKRIVDLYYETGGIEPIQRSYGPKPIITVEMLEEIKAYLADCEHNGE